MTILINSKEQEKATSGSDEENNIRTVTSKVSHIKLLLLRTPWYIIGLVVLVVGLALSQYRIHLPYEAECDDLYNVLNNSSTLTISTS